MGYLVATTGRLMLPPALERQALTVAEHRMAARDGWFDPDQGHVDSLADLAAYAGVTLVRDGDWLTVATDHEGDPKWSEQAEEFYRSLTGFVRQGEVHLRGEDGTSWSYSYSDAGIQRLGGPAPAAPAPEEPPAPTPPAPTPPPSEPGFVDYPGKEDRPPPRLQPPPPGDPQPQSWDTPGDDAPPASTGRVLAMTALLVVGVMLIIGLALVVSGF